MIDDLLYELQEGARKETIKYTTVGTTTFAKASYAWAEFVQVRCVGGGGGSGGCPTATVGATIHGPGGGGGAFSQSVIPVASLPAQVTITVGAGGDAGTPGVAGGTGGESAFGASTDTGGTIFCQSSGGTSGTAGTTGTQNHFNGGTGGLASYGDLRIGGSDGGNGLNGAGSVIPLGQGGAAGGGYGPARAHGATTFAVPGVLYGGGAKGPLAGTTSRNGATGAQGIVIVDLFG